jgi:GntR family transcriptional regulator
MEIAVEIRINPHDGLPIYLQIVQQTKNLVASGRLQHGDELPAIRVLAEQLLINPNTVARAYRELEVEGIVEKRRTAGTFISAQGSPLSRKERMKTLTDRIDQLLIEAKQLDFTLDDVLKLIAQRESRIMSSKS